ncbi:MAG: O-antigen ligase family protein [Deltaproteobacteria bacterium]
MADLNASKTKVTFWLLALALVFIYVRPYELIPILEKLKVAKIALLAALFFSFIESYKRGVVLKERGFRLLFYLQLLAVVLMPFAIWTGKAMDFWLESYVKIFALFYLIVVALEDGRKVDTVLRLIFVCCALVAGRVVLAFLTGNIIYDYDGTRRVMGISILSSTDPNDMALAIAMSLPIGMYFFYTVKGLLAKSFYLGLALICIAAILYSGSRGGYLGLLTGATVFFFMVYRTKKLRLAGFALLGLMALPFVPGDYQARFTSIFDSENYVYSEAGRLGIWKRGLSTVIREPQGVGISNFALTEGERKKEKGYQGKWHVAHNSYLQVAVELGVAGFILYSLFLYTGFKELGRIIRMSDEAGDARRRFCATALTASLVAFCISSFFLSQAYYWNHYIFIGVIIALKNVMTAEKTAREAIA